MDDSKYKYHISPPMKNEIILNCPEGHIAAGPLELKILPIENNGNIDMTILAACKCCGKFLLSLTLTVNDKNNLSEVLKTMSLNQKSND